MSGSHDGIVIGTIGGGGAAGLAVTTVPDTGVGAGGVVADLATYLLLSVVIAAAFICLTIALSAVLRRRR